MEADPQVRTGVGRRGRRQASAPTISIVIVSSDPEDVLESRISSIRSRFDPVGTEYVLAWTGSGRSSGDFKRRFPYVHVVGTSAGTSLAELRVQGIKAATGDIILLIRQDGSTASEFSGSAQSDSPRGSPPKSSSPNWFEHRRSAAEETVASHS